MSMFCARAIVGAPLLAAMMCAAPHAFAHVSLETRAYPAGATAKLVLKVPHGCAGSPTVNVRVRLPEDVLNAKPQPNAGWQLVTANGKLATPITGDHDETITESVREIHWTGGKLPDDHYDEFVFRAKLPNKPGETLYFPVVQECANGVNRWIEVPEPGKSRRDYKEPAPELRLLPAQ